MGNEQVIEQIRNSLQASYEFVFLDLFDDSHLHSRHNPLSISELTHLRIEYNLGKNGMSLVQEQRQLNQIIYNIFPKIHSISFKRVKKI